MKKTLWGWMSATMLFAASCSNDVAMLEDAGNEALVSLKVSTPEIASRAYSDGTTATRLQYAVYDKDGEYLSQLTKNNLTINGSTTVDLKLTTGNTYTVIFWAAAPDAPYTVDFAGKKMTVDYTNALSNDETRDAFYCLQEFEVNKKTVEVDVELKRPFAQLNIGTADYLDSEKAGYVPSQSFVKVRNIYNTLNLWDGTVSGQQEAVFGYNAIDKDEKFPVDDLTYDYLAMNYLLVNGKETVEVEFGYKEVGGIESEAEKTPRTIGSVPVQRNYRTNIFGNILTSDVDIHVTINPAYEEPDNYVFYAFERGGVATLTEDMEIGHTLYVRNGVHATLNLNGYTLKNNASNKYTDVIVVEEGAELTINGEGTIEAVSGNDGYAVIVEGTLYVNGGTFKAGVDANGEANAVIYARGNGKVYVKGGEFPNDNNSVYVLNKKDADRATTTIEVSGGRFHNFNPADNAAENAGTNFLAMGSVSVEVEAGVWEVLPNEVTVKNEAEFNAALTIGYGKIILGNDIELGAEGVTATKSTVIDMNGFSLTADRNYVSGKNVKDISVFVADNGAEIEFIGEGSIINTASEGAYAIVVWGGAKVTVSGNITCGAYHDAFYVRKGELFISNGFHYAVSDTIPGVQNCGTTQCFPSTVINCYDDDYTEVTLTGGTYVNMNPSNLHEWRHHNQSHVAEGYKVVEDEQDNGDIWYTVVKAE